MSFTQYIELKKRERVVIETKEAMRKKGAISASALHAANAYVQRTYGVAI